VFIPILLRFPPAHAAASVSLVAINYEEYLFASNLEKQSYIDTLNVDEPQAGRLRAMSLS
jgi:hypothetical protein